MVSEVGSKINVLPAGAGLNTSGKPAAVSSVDASPAPAELSIPKAEIRVDLERESQDVREAIGRLNDMLTASARSVSFSMDERLGRPIVYVKNSTTGEVIRQIPNEVVVRIAHSIEDLKGLLHNEKI